MTGRMLVALTVAALGFGQTPLTVTLQDALARARQHAGQIQTANLAALQAKEDRCLLYTSPSPRD